MANLDQQGITNIDPELCALESQISYNNYSVVLSGKIFFFEQELAREKEFIPTLIMQIYRQDLLTKTVTTQREIAGRTLPLDFNTVQQKIAGFFSYFGTDSGDIAANYGCSDHQKRLKEYWGIIEKNYPLPPTDCFEFIPNTNSLFAFYLGWSCILILLNKNTGQGILMHLDASC